MAGKTIIAGTNWIGDSVMSLAAIREVRRLYPDDHLALFVREWVAELFRGQGLVDEILPAERGASAMRGFDRAILLRNAFKAAWQALLARVPRRIGYSTDLRGGLLSERAQPRIKLLRRHQVYYYLDLLYQTEVSPINYLEDTDFQPDISLRPRDRWISEARQLLEEGEGPLVAVNPGAYFGPAKRWFPERYAQVADRLIEQCEARVAIVGAEGERRIAAEIDAAMKHPPQILAGRTSLGGLIGVIALSDCFITNDSGPMHLAAALGVRQLALFGSTDPVATGPYSPSARVIRHRVECSPCLLRECPIDLRCFARIEAGEVFEAARGILNRHG